MNNPIKDFDKELEKQIKTLVNNVVEYESDLDTIKLISDHILDTINHVIWSHFLNDLEYDIQDKMGQGLSLEQVFEEYRK